MNKQAKPNGSRGIEWTDFTWNPVAGCQHSCRWEMPDGTIAECYAETIAERVAGSAYPFGFEHHYWYPQRLEMPLKQETPARIFIDSMSDLMGNWVSDAEIESVLAVCRKAHWHHFQLLTKNAPRLLKFEFPKNVWVGASAPPTFMFGRRLSHKQQERMVSRTLDVLDQVDVPVRWMSIEPLSFDISTVLKGHELEWAVIGAATNGSKAYQPEKVWVENVLQVLDLQNTRIFFKGNLKWDDWREEMPKFYVNRMRKYRASLKALKTA